MPSTLMAIAKKKYRYTNRISSHVDPSNKTKLIAQSETTGDSQGYIVNEALTEYFKRKEAAKTASKNSY